MSVPGSYGPLAQNRRGGAPKGVCVRALFANNVRAHAAKRDGCRHICRAVRIILKVRLAALRSPDFPGR